PAWGLDDFARPSPFRNNRTRIVGALHINEHRNVIGTAVLDGLQLAHQAHVIGEIGFLASPKTGVARRVDAGCAAEGWDAEAGIVGQSGSARVLTGMAGFGNRILYECDVRVVGFRHAQRARSTHAYAARFKYGRKLAYLARIVRSKHDLTRGILTHSISPSEVSSAIVRSAHCKARFCSATSRAIPDCARSSRRFKVSRSNVWPSAVPCTSTNCP